MADQWAPGHPDGKLHLVVATQTWEDGAIRVETKCSSVVAHIPSASLTETPADERRCESCLGVR